MIDWIDGVGEMESRDGMSLGEKGLGLKAAWRLG